MTMTSAPAAAAACVVAAVTRVVNCSTGDDCRMSSALPSRDAPLGIDQAHLGDTVAAGQRVRERAAERAAPTIAMNRHRSRLF